MKHPPQSPSSWSSHLEMQLRLGCFAAGVFVLFLSGQKQIFDFLGYMWIPMLGNFVNMVFSIFLCFGCWHRRPSFLLGYLVWSLPVWIPFNAFLVCYYAEVGGLRRTQDLLTFGTRSFSWWLANGYGCKPEYFTNSTLLDDTQLMYPIRPGRVTGCFMEYHMVEILQASVQLCLSLLASAGAAFYLHVLLSRLKHKGRNGGGNHNQSIYSIEYSPQVNNAAAVDHHGENVALYSNVSALEANRAVQMTPRRVKRRSYTRSSARSTRSHRLNRNANGRNTVNSVPGGSLRLKSLNPVTRLLERDSNDRPLGGRGSHLGGGGGHDSSTSNDEALRHHYHGPSSVEPLQQLPGYGQINPAYESSRPNSLYSNGTTVGGNGPLGGGAGGGHSSSRPPSALTSYSNFHGQRKPAGGGGGPGHSNFPQHQHQQPMSLLITQDNLLRNGEDEGSNGVASAGGGPGASASGAAAAAADTSFDDLPPPPPPIAALAATEEDRASPPQSSTSDAAAAALHHPGLNGGIGRGQQGQQDGARSDQVQGGMERLQQHEHHRGNPSQIPVPQQRTSSNVVHASRNEYVNMPLLQPQQPQQPQQQQQQVDPHAYSTLKADGHHLMEYQQQQQQRPSSPSTSSSHQPQHQSRPLRQQQHHREPAPLPLLPPANHPAVRGGGAVTTSEDDYGFSSVPSGPPSSSARAFNGGGFGNPRPLPPKNNAAGGGIHHQPRHQAQHQQQQQQQNSDKWYLKDSMRPVGASVHGGNCKCYRCQRKLTAI